jgi:hypothetical protein
MVHICLNTFVLELKKKHLDWLTQSRNIPKSLFSGIQTKVNVSMLSELGLVNENYVNPTVSYNASAVEIYKPTSSLLRFEIFLTLK